MVAGECRGVVSVRDRKTIKEDGRKDRGNVRVITSSRRYGNGSC